MSTVDALKRYRTRLEDLITQGDVIKASARPASVGSGEFIDEPKWISWKMSAKTVIHAIAPTPHFGEEFDSLDEMRWGAAAIFERQLGVLRGLLSDLDGGYLSNFRGLIRAEVFTDLLDQAEHLLDEGYHLPAAVVVGAVLEDHLRGLCAKNSIALPPKPKLDTMNADLSKAGEYNGLEQKRVTAWADLRNKAAHGKIGEFTKAHVEDMQHGVLAFLVAHPL